MPLFQAAWTVAIASSFGMSRYMLPSGAVPKPMREGMSILMMVYFSVVRAGEPRVIRKPLSATAKQRFAMMRGKIGPAA